MQRAKEILQRAVFLGDHPYFLLNAILKNQELQERIIELNTQGQLFQKGIDSKGKSLEDIGGFYSFNTVQIKRGKGQPTDRVTLKDTGAFYESFRIVIGQDSFHIEANTIKDEDDLTERWGKDILGLTEESRLQLIEWIKHEMVPKAIEFLLAA